MNVTFAYRGRSDVVNTAGGQSLHLAPNLARDPVAFDAPLLQPLRFREAMSALHDAVISDLRFKKRDKSAYRAWKADEAKRVGVAAQAARAEAAAAIAAERAKVEADGSFKQLKREFDDARKTYWTARYAYSDYLKAHDQELWRQLLPYDPVVTVADDALLFECFSADESTYGCLTVQRDGGFGSSSIPVLLGTTNVDYSWALYHHFQTLRTYRQTRFSIDPGGFAVATDAAGDHREEKIDLPQGWLKGFMQLQAAMTMPMAAVVPLSREAVYSVVAFLKRHKAKTSPRAMRFELTPGEPPAIVLEPWETRIVSHDTRYTGPPTPPIRVWGIRRLSVLARTLPLAERFDVHLLGTGLPSFWVARMGEMRLTVGLSGWTTNDWTRSAALDMLAPPAAVAPDTITNVAAIVRELRRVTLADLNARLGMDAASATAALRSLAQSGQVIHDLPGNCYRWRQVTPRALGEADVGGEHPEMAAARRLVNANRVTIGTRLDAPGLPGGTVLTGAVESYDVETTVDGDNRIRKGKCGCSYYRRAALKNGPCRHMMALRWSASVAALEAQSASAHYNRLAGNS